MMIVVKISSSILSNKQGSLLELPEEELTVAELITNKLRIEMDEVGLVLLNGCKADRKDIVTHGSKVQILPWFYGG